MTQQQTQSNQNSNSSMKIILVGDQSIGKTCVLIRFSRNEYNECYEATIGSNVYKEEIIVNEKKYKLDLWDTCGGEKYRRSLLPQFFRNAKCVVVTYATNNRNTFESLDYWIQIVNEIVGDEIPIVICATKSDCEVIVSPNDGKRFAKERNYPFISCSSKENENIRELFELCVKTILEHDLIETQLSETIELNISTNEKKKSKCCSSKSKSIQESTQ